LRVGARQDAACEPTWPDFVGRFWENRGMLALHQSASFIRLGEEGRRLPLRRNPCVRGVGYKALGGVWFGGVVC
jgi:hypothetical protein